MQCNKGSRVLNSQMHDIKLLVPTAQVVSVKPGSQYDAGTMSVTSVTEKSFHQSNCISNVKFFDNLIGWTLAYARNTTLE